MGMDLIAVTSPWRVSCGRDSAANTGPAGNPASTIAARIVDIFLLVENFNSHPVPAMNINEQDQHYLPVADSALVQNDEHNDTASDQRGQMGDVLQDDAATYR